MYNQTKIKRILQSSKNSTTVLKKSYNTKNQKLLENRKYSNEKYKTQIINHIYNKLFLYSNDYLQNVSNNNTNMNKSNYNNFMNTTKRNVSKNLIRNSHKYKSINQKNSIPFPIKKTSKDKLKIKTKLYGSYMSNDMSKNYLKPTNSTTEINITSDDNNVTQDYNNKEKKNVSMKQKNECNNNNITNNNDKNMEQKNSTKKGNNHNYNKSSTSNILQRTNDSANSRVLKVIETNLKDKKKKIDISKKNKNKLNQKNIEINSLKKEENKNNNKKNIQSTKNKVEIQKKNQNNIFDSLKENKVNYYFLVVSGNKLNNKKIKENNKFINKNNNTVTKYNNNTCNLEELHKYSNKIDLSPIPNLLGDSTTKLRNQNNHKLFLNNEEIMLSDEGKKYLNYTNIIKNEQSISERKNNKYKNIIINPNLINNDNNNKFSDKKENTFHKKNKIINNYKNNYIKYKESKNSKPFSQNIIKKTELNDKMKSIENKKNNNIKRKLNKNSNINKKNKNNNIDINDIFKNNNNNNLKNVKYKIKNSNSNISILETNSNEKFNNKYNLKNSNKSNNIIISNSKIIYSNNKENKYKKKLENSFEKQKSNSNITEKNTYLEFKYKEKNDLNNKFFENFKDNINNNNNNISIFDSDEDDKTDKEEEEKENTPRINKLVTYFNDAKKTLKKSNVFYKNKNVKTFLEVISPNKSTIINPIYNKMEDDELSNRTIKVPIFVDVNLLNNLLDKNINSKNINLEIKNLYDIISKPNNFKPKKLLLHFLDDKSLMILSSINRQFYINLRIIFYNNLYRKIFNDKKNIFKNKIMISMFSYASREIKNYDKAQLRQIYESYGNKKSIYDDLIIKDINRTFPHDLNFSKNSLKYTKLYNLLTRYSNYKKSIGYAQGLNFIFANAMSYFEKEEECFLFIDGLINSFKIENYMGENNSTLTSQIKKYSNIISKYIPDVIKYLAKKLLTHEFFSTGWILTLFSNAMNSNNLMITWSFMIVFGWKFFYCFVIQILHFYRNDIYKTSENNLSKKMKRLLKEERFNNDIKQIINNTFYFMSQNIVL